MVRFVRLCFGMLIRLFRRRQSSGQRLASCAYYSVPPSCEWQLGASIYWPAMENLSRGRSYADFEDLFHITASVKNGSDLRWCGLGSIGD
jgi:hypothetical protein